MSGPIVSGVIAEPGTRRGQLSPDVGWTPVALVAVLVLVAAWSIQDARWILGRGSLTGFLWEVGIAGVAWGVLAGILGWSRPRTYLTGAVVGAFLVPVVVGRILDTGADPIAAFGVTASSAVQAYLDLAWRGKPLTQQVGHYMLALGLIVWATGLFASYAVVKRHRPLDAVVVTGLVLLVDMSLTLLDQLYLLVIFSVAALLLLVRLHATDEASTWVRRRMGDPERVSSLYVRGGAAFAIAAIFGSLVLTSTASSAPLASAWTGAQQSLIDAAQGLERYFPRGGPGTRFTGVAFGPQAAITGQWVTDTGIALTIQVPRSDTTRHYWRAYAYDRFDLQGWSITDTKTISSDPNAPLDASVADLVGDPSTMTKVSYTVRPIGYRGHTAFTPGVPVSIDRASQLYLLAGRYYATLDRQGDGAATYSAQALVAAVGDVKGGLTANKLRVAGTSYPALVRQLYLPVPDGSLGPNSLALLKTIRNLAPATDAYDLAKTMEGYLRSDVFTYTTNVAGLDCGDRSVVECFATFKQGYCQHYASTMTILLREAGIPARYVEGFLPGQRDGSGMEVIRNSSSHAWVEVYFPHYGWVPFDPTGGGVATLTSLPSGERVTPLSDTPANSDGTDTGDTRQQLRPGGGPGGSGSTTSGDGAPPPTGAFAVIAIVLATLVGWAAFEAYRRGPRHPVPPDAIFASVSAIAARLGFARRPTETVYEYAGSLGEILPAARPELQTVAHATVEVAYGRQELAEDRLRALVQAERRLRVALLGLVFRFRRRRRR